MPPRIPDERRAAILTDIQARAGSTRTIADKHGVSTKLVRTVAQEAGISDAWSRDRTENATRARVADMKARRAAIASGLLDDAEKLRARAWAPYTVPMSMGGKEGGIELVTTELPPLGEVRNAYTAVGIALDKHLRLDAHDGDGAAEQIGSLLGSMFDRLQADHGGDA